MPSSPDLQNRLASHRRLTAHRCDFVLVHNARCTRVARSTRYYGVPSGGAANDSGALYVCCAVPLSTMHQADFGAVSCSTQHSACGAHSAEHKPHTARSAQRAPQGMQHRVAFYSSRQHATAWSTHHTGRVQLITTWCNLQKLSECAKTQIGIAIVHFFACVQFGACFVLVKRDQQILV